MDHSEQESLYRLSRDHHVLISKYDTLNSFATNIINLHPSNIFQIEYLCVLVHCEDHQALAKYFCDLHLIMEQKYPKMTTVFFLQHMFKYYTLFNSFVFHIFNQSLRSEIDCLYIFDCIKNYFLFILCFNNLVFDSETSLIKKEQVIIYYLLRDFECFAQYFDRKKLIENMEQVTQIFLKNSNKNFSLRQELYLKKMHEIYPEFLHLFRIDITQDEVDVMTSRYNFLFSFLTKNVSHQ